MSLDFDPKQNLVCFIGRGDSGKSTVLEAISAVLSSAWNLTFHDTDFYNCLHDSSIEIQASLVDIPEKLLSAEKFGLYARGFDERTSDIIDEIILDEENSDLKPLLTLKLVVNESLEPQWTVTNNRTQDDKFISGSERALLHCYMVSDQIDKHFSWNKGNPLYSLLKASSTNEPHEESNVIIKSLRLAKSKIDEHGFNELQNVTDHITTQAAALGLNILNTNTTLDFKELSIKDGRISLHEDLVPFRLKGKGSKRLISLAIQLALVENGGVMLVDEIEQGLEPDRVRQLIRTLKDNSHGQIFLTTHSREVITELGGASLCLILKDNITSTIEARPIEKSKDSLV